MTTITSSTTATPTPTASTASVTSSAANSLLTSLGSGSGVDTAALVTKLVDAQFADKNAQLTAKNDALTAQISGVATLKSTITDFTKALENLVKGGTLATQPVGSNSAVATATALSGATLTGLNTTVRVDQLAAAQTATSAKIASPATTTFGTGTLSLQFGTATVASDGTMSAFTAGSAAAVSITIDGTNNSLSGIAAAINAAKAGVTASVVTDADGGAFLSVKGATGATQAFTLTADTAGSPLAQFEVAPPTSGSTSTMGIRTKAQNAKLSVDGVAVERTANEVSDLVPGVKLSLTSLGATTLTASRPTAALTSAVNDFVDTYNQVLAVVKEQTDPITGQLRADPAARTLLRSMQSLTSRILVPGAAAGTPSSLSAIGVRTNKDGTLSVDDTALAAVMTRQPEAVEAMFSAATTNGSGVLGAMQSLQLAASSTVYGLGASTKRYKEAQSDLTKSKDKVADQATRMTTRLTQQYASMNSRVSAYKATQSFMQQQIDNWTKSTG